MNWLRLTGLILAGLLTLSGFAHAFLGLPALQSSLAQKGVENGSELWVDATAGWLFGSMAMLAFGIIFASVVLSLPRGRPNLASIAAIGIGYAVFGLGSLTMLNFSPHFVMFSVLGLLFLIWALVAWRRTAPSPDL